MQFALFADKHPLMAQATKELLNQIGNVKVVSVAESGMQCLSETEHYQPDLIILDHKMKDVDGSVIKEIKEISPKTKVIIFTGSTIDGISPEVLSLADGLVSKEAGHETVKHAFLCAKNGYYVVPGSIQKHITFPTDLIEIGLNDEEALIMNLVIRGSTIEKIADELFVSKRTVDNYQRRIYQKMGVNNRAEAIELFMRSKHYEK
jgi:DNA-binding NarL/FixJ family response regulator